ncbi:hypothetical protein IIC65_02090 [Candidatus Sumerlaeota bacterium]|nr:hypothetical protein [Candidatus Sumerlaeota bacterium]
MDSTKELGYLQRTVAVLPHSAWTRLTVSGRDAVDYLHRRLSQSVTGLARGHGAHALQLDGDGRMQAELLIYRLGDEIDLLVPLDQSESIAALIEEFVIMDDVTVRRRESEERIIALAGPAAGRVLQRLAAQGTALDRSHTLDAGTAGILQAFGLRGEIGGHACRIYLDPRWGIPFFHLAVAEKDCPSLAACLIAECEKEMGGEAGPEALDYFRIQRGITRHGLDTTDSTIPLEAALDGAVDMSKGCFPGQEVLARIINLGHPARLWFRFELEGEHEIDAGAAISARVEGAWIDAGTVTSSRTLAGLRRTAALGRLQWKFRDCSEAMIATASGKVPATGFPLEAPHAASSNAASAESNPATEKEPN